jgi:CRP-like cAMP-binding protein
MTKQEIQAIPLFEDVPRARRNELASFADRLTVPAGRALTRQGELAHEFFLIVDGLAEIVRDGHRVAIAGPGDFVGEIGLLGDPIRTATVTAATELDLVVFARREFRTMLNRNPEVASTILMTASRRIAAMLRELEAA